MSPHRSRLGLGAAALVGVLLLRIDLPAQTAADTAVQVSATVQAAPPKITLSWPANPSATRFVVYRKAFSDTSWGAAIATLSGSVTGYADSNVAVGATYEYRVDETATVFATGYLASGIEAPLTESRGKVVLIVDSTYASSLSAELSRLQQDLVGDGWIVLRHDVARTETVSNVKALIEIDYNRDPTNVKAVFLFGHVPVFYAGATAPDGHSGHYGAWPADLYYGDVDGVWTDSQNFDSTVAGRQHNVAGDRKFDQTYAPSPIDLEVGRVDLVQTVKDTVTVTLTSSPNPSSIGQRVTPTATVTPTPPSSSIPTGTIAFTDGATTLSTVSVLYPGTATLNTTSLTLGSHTIVATYSGDSTLVGGSSAPLVQVVTGPLSFYTLPPCRALDTRRPVGPTGGPALSASTSRLVALTGQCGVPASARALAANVTVTQSTAQGFLTLYPGGTPLAGVSTINYRAGQTRANNAILSLGTGGNIAIWCGQASGTAHVIVDIDGYFQ